MNSSTEDGLDNTSIKPVSSLKSKFENLAKDNVSTLSRSSTPRQGSLEPNGQRKEADVLTKGRGGQSLESDTREGASRPVTTNGRTVSQPVVADNGLEMPIPRRLRQGPPVSRPASVVGSTPTRGTPPSLAVDLPVALPKSPLMNASRAPSQQRVPSKPTTPNGSDRSPTSHAHANTHDISKLPLLDARQTSSSPVPDPVKISASPTISSSPNTTGPAGLTKSSVPPAVNRAAKPKIPAKPAPLTMQSKTLVTPDYRVQMAERSHSPFATPPGSGASSPDMKHTRPRQDSGAQQGLRHGSDVSQKERARTDSDASWVQRLRTDSDLSVAGRDRADSSASFVEVSELPDNWLPPPVHHAVAAKREHQSNGFSRSLPMPVRSDSLPARTSTSPGEVDGDRPRLPTRPELQMRSGRVSPPKARSGRTSPTKLSSLNPQRSMDTLSRVQSNPQTTPFHATTTSKPAPRSALSLGFDRPTHAIPPAVPAPRRSTERRHEAVQPLIPANIPVSVPIPSAAVAVQPKHTEDQSDGGMESIFSASTNGANSGNPVDYPDATQSNRRPPRYKQRPWQIPTGYDTRLLAVCGDHVCTTGFVTKVWNMRTSEQLLDREHREGVRVLSVVFVPMKDMRDEGARLWLGTNIGEIHEIDIASRQLESSNASAHQRREIIKLYRYGREVWSLDDAGDLSVWKPDRNGTPNLHSQPVSFRVPRAHSFSIACGPQLWIAAGKDLRVFLPSARSDAEFLLTRGPLTQPGVGDITAGAMLNGASNLVYFGHADGKVSVYDRTTFTCTAVVNVSLYRISALAAVAGCLWAGYSTGMTYVYDTSTTPWTVRKDWQAHEKQVCAIVADPSAIWTMGRLNVVTLSTDNNIRIWDGMLGNDLLDGHMRAHDSEFCNFRELTVSVLTWNAGASRPEFLRHNKEDDNFFREYLSENSTADVLVFGFQELVDLEDKKLTAKTLFKSKKKDPYEQEHMSHQYREWRDHLNRCVNEFMAQGSSYVLLHTASMVGLFTCIFVKASERSRIKHVHTSEVKCGMGGRYGNKGALILRMVSDDTSICFVNCHLAAGQSHTVHRNNDVGNILEASSLPTYPLHESHGAQHNDVFINGGDGGMILDHEICILNGDLNYRIDTMGRDAVVRHVQQGNLARLLERDQLLLSRRKNPGFRLRAFQESAITFAPTYKYNLHSDEYDTSEKRRAPAWCDRILYRGLGRVKMEDYRRWDGIRVSDHRPVSGRLRVRVKAVDPAQRERVWEQCLRELDDARERVERAAQLEYLTNVLGMPHKESLAALQQTAKRR